MIHIVGNIIIERIRLITHLTDIYIKRHQSLMKYNSLTFTYHDDDDESRLLKANVILYLTNLTDIKNMIKFAKKYNKKKIIVVIVRVTKQPNFSNFLHIKPKNVIDYVIVRNDTVVYCNTCKVYSMINVHFNSDQFYCKLCRRIENIVNLHGYYNDNICIECKKLLHNDFINGILERTCQIRQCKYYKKIVPKCHKELMDKIKRIIIHKKFIIQLKRKDFIDIIFNIK